MKRVMKWLDGLRSHVNSQAIKKSDHRPKAAVLVDFENVSGKMLEAAVVAVNTVGPGCIFKAYGAKERLKGPAHRFLKENGATLVLGRHLTPGKNGSDMLMAMDAIELLHLQGVREFVLVTSDSDFAPLCDLVRKHGANAVVIGSTKAGASLQAAASDFIELRKVSAPLPEPVITVETPQPSPIGYLEQICQVTADLTDADPKKVVSLSTLGTALSKRGLGRAKDHGYGTLYKAIAADKRLVLTRENCGEVRLSQTAAKQIRNSAQRTMT